jgi:hypothetical protein
VLTAEDLAAGLRRVVALLGEEAPADPLADLGAEGCLADAGADLLLPPVRPDGEAAHGALSQQAAGATEPSLAVAHPGAHAGALKAATETGLQLGVMGR